jgi:multidrug efflux pump subunit AcrA (membrane-fusion protein)
MGRRGIVLILGLVSLAAGCRDTSAVAPPPPPVVKVEAVLEKDVPITSEWVARWSATSTRRSAPASANTCEPELSGGTLVKSGDLLFIDSRPFQTALDQAEARLNLAESQLSQAKAQVSASQAQVEQAIAKVAQDEAQVKRAEATQRQTELDVARYTPLAQRGSVSQQELDNAVQSNLANLATVAASRAAVQNSQASVSRSRAALAKSHADVKTRRPSPRRAPRWRMRGSTSATPGCCRRSRGWRDSAARTSATTSARAIRRL